MGRKIVWVNETGSVGKTTTAVNIAALMAERGNKVRVIGLDAQGNAEHYLGVQETSLHTGDLLVERDVRTQNGSLEQLIYSLGEVESPVGIQTDDPAVKEWLQRISVVPAGDNLYADAVLLDRDPFGVQRLSEALEDDDEETINLIDCPGSKSILSINALVALDPKKGDRIVTCTPPDWKGAGGLGKLQKTINEVTRSTRRDAQIDAVVPCRVPPTNRGKFYQERLDDLRDSDGPWASRLTPTIREAVTVAESYYSQEPLPIYVPKDPVTQDHRDILQWMDEHGITQ